MSGMLTATTRHRPQPSSTISSRYERGRPERGLSERRYLRTEPTPLRRRSTTYDYAGQDPINSYDLTGECPVCVVAVAFGVVAVVGATYGAYESWRHQMQTSELARRIANGHAWEKHEREFRPIGVTDQRGFEELIKGTIENPSEKQSLEGGRKAYWNDEKGAVVITNPKDPDGGTAFRPKRGKRYFKDLKKR